MEKLRSQSSSKRPFDTGTPQAELLAALLANPSTTGRLSDLQDELGPGNSDPQTGIDLLTAMIRKLPAEAYASSGLALEIVDSVLGSARAAIDKPLELSTSQLLGTYLQQLDQLEDPESRRRLEILLDRTLNLADEDHQKTLAPYLNRLFEADAESDQGLQHLMVFLRRTRRTSALSRCAELHEDAIAFGFPTHFTLFLDSLDLSHRSMQRLSGICYGLTRERVVSARKVLLRGSSILEPGRIRRLLTLESREVLPFVSLILDAGEDWVIPKVAQFLRKLDLLEAESAALRVLEDSSLPRTYLSAVCDGAIAGTEDKQLREQSQLLITSFIDSSGDASAAHDRRLFAIRTLRFFPDAGTYHYLQDLATAGKLLKRSKPARAIRDAAAETASQLGVRS